MKYKQKKLTNESDIRTLYRLYKIALIKFLDKDKWELIDEDNKLLVIQKAK